MILQDYFIDVAFDGAGSRIDSTEFLKLFDQSIRLSVLPRNQKETILKQAKLNEIKKRRRLSWLFSPEKVYMVYI